MIPLGGMGVPLAGPVPPEVHPRFVKLKYCVFALLVSIFCRLIVGIFLGVLASVLINSIQIIYLTCAGIFLLKDDPEVGRIYEFLRTTCCQICTEQCGGGISCLMPWIMLNVITLAFDIIFKGVIQQMIASIALLFKTGTSPSLALLNTILTVALVSAFSAEVVGTWQGWQAYKEVRDLGAGQGAPGEWSSGGGSVYNSGPQREPRSGQEMQAPPRQANFQPFAGAGNRLGS
eukprot:TRINITY_DN9219_c0_g1_i2.p1 TRINITY_DN9219_c0_g1~~TRINITY_DN9219_c0_g1_i2.p1  ORF type:complete len:232 (-),score=26.43 TRINITY_DN9219_c0_g1_i2:31-726(-)